MAENVNTRGRKPKTVEDAKVEVEAVATTDDMSLLIKQMQEQILQLQNKLQESTNEKTDLEKIVDALKSGGTEKNLPKKVKIVSLMPNQYNLSTQAGGHGKTFSFNKFGDMITIKTSELEEILSVPAYRSQAESGYFYILDKDIVEDQDLTDAYSHISDKETIENVMHLANDECVDIFCGLSKDMQDSLASIMAEMINNGEKLDRNRLNDISMRADIDILEIAKQFAKAVVKEN